MSSYRKAETIKAKIINNRYIGSIGSYIMYWLEVIGIIDSIESPNDVRHIWSGTQSQYNDLDEVRDDTLYFIE